MGDVDHPRVRRDPRDDAVTGADEVVLQPEVAEKADDHASTVAGDLPTHGLTAATSPSRSCVSASASTSTPASRAARVVSGPIDTAGMPVPSAAKARAADGEAEHDEVAVRCRVGDELAGSVERDEVGVELVDEEPPRALGRCEQHLPGRPRQLGEEPFLRRDAGYEVGAAERLPLWLVRSRRRAGAARRRGAASSRAPFALVTTTQS